VWVDACGVTGDFATPALELGRLGSRVSSFGVPRDGGRFSSSFGLAFTGIGFGGFGWTARGNCGLIVDGVCGCDVGKALLGLSAGECWR
jgi:hypothetical protein